MMPSNTKQILPDTHKEPIFYIGPSMLPTLRCADRLFIAPYGKRRVRSGDVVVFFSPGNNQKVVHRVISASRYGIRTKGDNNGKVDPWLLNPSDILGCVAYVRRKNKKLRFYGGLAGRLCLTFFKMRRLLSRGVSCVFGPAYRYLARRRVFLRLMPSWMKIRCFMFERPWGKEEHFLLNRFLIARSRGQKPGSIRWPFRLLLGGTSQDSIDKVR